MKYPTDIIKKIPIIQFLYLYISKRLSSTFLLIYPIKKYGKNVIILETENSYPILLKKPAKKESIIANIKLYK